MNLSPPDTLSPGAPKIGNDLLETAAWDVPSYDVTFWEGRTSDYCVIIPVINEGQRIRTLLERMKTLRTHELADIVVVDGGSTDGSLNPTALRELGVQGLLIKTGAGKLSAQLRCGYAFALGAGFGGIVTIDGNNKDDPAGIVPIIEALRIGYDFIQGSRFAAGGIAENTPFIRHLAISLIHAPLLRFFSGFPWTDTTQGFRGYSARLLLDPRISIFRACFISYELLAYLSYRSPRLGFRCKEVGTTRSYPAGEIPTKISAIRGNLSVLSILIKACLGCYNPDRYKIC